MSFFSLRCGRGSPRPVLAACVATAAISLFGLTVLSGSARAARSATTPRVAAQRTVALLFGPHSVYRVPRPDARSFKVIDAHRPITGERTALPVDGRATDVRGTRWLRVELPGRPNGSSGWIREHRTRLTVTAWHLLIDLRTRTVSAYLDGRRARVFAAVVGKPSTPTPTGDFFVEETVTMPAGDPGGPYALALSARSNVLRHFDGGPGQVAVHGRDDLGGTLGAAQSHGCVRLATASITWLARRIGPGVPVTIVSG